MTNRRVKTVLLNGMTALGGVGTGFAVERTGLVSPVSESSFLATLDEVPYFECPDEVALSDLHRGDRVYDTGRTADGEWVEIRAPYDPESRAWVRYGRLIPDAPLVAAAVATPSCIHDEPANGPDTTSSTTAPPSITTSDPTATPTSSSMSSTTATSSATTTPATTTTTPPADQQSPSVDFFQSTESELWENANYGGCPTRPQTAQVSDCVFDPSGISSVQLAWSVGSSGGALAMSEITADVYSVTIGPFGESMLSGADASISLTLTARDTSSNSTSVVSSSLTLLHDCVVG